ncbi:hypothetical protein DFH06DRAFT_1468554 [Mycena polygramma]|nr:hypothetical protein DFH06DRAFT_1468554 [Mycena polygramma]
MLATETSSTTHPITILISLSPQAPGVWAGQENESERGDGGTGHFGLTKEHSALSDRCPTFLHAPTIICRAVGQDETPTFLEAGFTALHMEYGDSVNICYDYGNEMPLPCLPPLHRAAGVHRKYHGVYANGTDALRLKRLEKLQELGLVRHPVVTDEVKACTDMSNDERAKSARETEVFAAMVE